MRLDIIFLVLLLAACFAGAATGQETVNESEAESPRKTASAGNTAEQPPERAANGEVELPPADAEVPKEAEPTPPAISLDKQAGPDADALTPFNVRDTIAKDRTSARSKFRTSTESDEEVPYKYLPPTRKSKFKYYLNSAVGPFALISEAASAYVTTRRNAPKEWGYGWKGWGRRFASNMGKNVIKQSTAFALDEAMGLDSRFYRSRDRSTAARFRNALFSSVTARNKQGKRVIGIPKIAGSVLANVTAAEVWYPGRYNYVHGLKGGAISLALDVGLNITKEFIWK